MKKLTILFFVMVACLCGLQVSAQPTKAPARSAVYSYLPSGYISLGSYNNPSHIYYSTQTQHAVRIGDVNGVSIVGEVDGKYYSTTYAAPLASLAEQGISTSATSEAGCGFIAAMKVEGGGLFANENALICDCQNGTTRNDVSFSVRVERAGEYASKVIFTLTNEAGWSLFTSTSRTVSLGIWADIMIGDNDNAPIYCLRNDQGQVYGLDMKYKSEEEAQPGEKIPVFTVVFDGASGVAPVDDWWFGRYSNNYEPEEIVGNYDSKCDIQVGSGTDATWQYDVEDEFYKVEGGSYDSGMGFCWKNITLARGESVELSFVSTASEIDIDEPEPDPDAEYHAEAYDCDAWNDLPADHPARVWGYYKHPFDWTSHVEYSVDGGEWTAIPGDLAPNSNFDLSFNMNFNPDVDDIHTLKLRLVDVEGNPTYLEDLNMEWEDIRTLDLTVNPQTQYYDGTPKTFVVTIGGAIDYTLGENGEYVEPGTYSYSIYGVYDVGTIGVNTVEFSIVRRTATVNVVVPEDCEYDGEEHAATASTDGDGNVIVTYKDSEGNISNDAPVEPGTYEVFVEVTDGPTCDGIANASYGSFTISKKQPVLNVEVPEDCIYDGREHAAVVTYDGDGEVTVTYVNTNTNEESNVAPTEPGTYAVFVQATEGDHYEGVENTYCGTFTIGKKEAELIVIVPEDCVYDGNEHAATVLYNGDGDVIVTYVPANSKAVYNEGPTEPGTYAVFVEVTEGEYYAGMENTKYGEFTIDRRQCEYNAVLPDATIKYDGNQYGATVTVPEGSGNVTVTYLNLADNTTSTTPPSEVGRYAIILYIDDTGEYYYGMEDTIICTYEIYLIYPTAVNELNADQMDNGAWYTIDGRRVAAPNQPGIYIRNGKKYYVK